MNEALQQVLKKHHPLPFLESLKESVQEIALLALWRSKFFEKAALFGGFSLRTLYHLPRRSENMNFSLLKSTENFQWSSYLNAIIQELKGFDLCACVFHLSETEYKPAQASFSTSFTEQFQIEVRLSKHLRKSKIEDRVRIKLEIDTNPPLSFQTEIRLSSLPIPLTIKTMVRSDLFAGKLHSLLCLSWKEKVRGRDWFDFAWFVEQQVPLKLQHLEKRMQQSGHLKKMHTLKSLDLQKLIREKIENLDLSQALEDIHPLLLDPSQVKNWSREYFLSIASRLQILQ